MPTQKDIPVLKRAMQVLEAVTAREKATAKELSMDLEIPQATCYRILHSLTEVNWLRRDHEGYYHLSFGISRLGSLAANMARVIAKVQQPMADLRRETGLSIKISVREDLDWLLLARTDIPTGIPLPQAAGTRAPVIVGSVGAALLSQYDDARLQEILEQIPPRVWQQYDRQRVTRAIQTCKERGYASDLGQTHPKIHAISIPLPLPPLEVIGALTAVGSPEQLPASDAVTTLEALKNRKREIERSLSA
jgi:DNA-binding IclR family transcriptional regulator